MYCMAGAGTAATFRPQWTQLLSSSSVCISQLIASIDTNYLSQLHNDVHHVQSLAGAHCVPARPTQAASIKRNQIRCQVQKATLQRAHEISTRGGTLHATSANVSHESGHHFNILVVAHDSINEAHQS
jgi:hypothetical protein